MPDYFRPSVTVDVLVLDWSHGAFSLLLIQRDKDPFAGHWALPSGFIEPEETLEASARRELAEETGLSVAELQTFGTYGDPGRDPRGRTLTVAYLALTSGQPLVRGQDDARDARYFPLSALPELSFDHARIIADGLDYLRAQLAHRFAGTPLPLPDPSAAAAMQAALNQI